MNQNKSHKSDRPGDTQTSLPKKTPRILRLDADDLEQIIGGATPSFIPGRCPPPER